MTFWCQFFFSECQTDIRYCLYFPECSLYIALRRNFMEGYVYVKSQTSEALEASFFGRRAVKILATMFGSW